MRINICIQSEKKLESKQESRKMNSIDNVLLFKLKKNVPKKRGVI